MAATRLIALHENKGKTVSKCLKDRVDYAKNREKTEDGEYVTAYECNPEIVDQEFYSARNEYLKNHRSPGRDIIAYQIRQSFKPGEITPEEANAVGYELAMRFTKGNHAFIVATHTDKAHIHNHIIFNSINTEGDKRFRDFFFSGIALRRLSDEICLEHGLSVIKPKPYKDRDKRSDYPKRDSYRDNIREAINRALAREPKDMEEFFRMLEEEEYHIRKGMDAAIKGREQKRYIRFSSLGDGYRMEDIEKNINGEITQDPEIRKRTNENNKNEKKMDLLIDIQAKLAQGKGAGYERWAKVYNIKQIAKVLLFLEENGIRDVDALADKAKEASDHFNDLSTTIKDAEKRMAEITVLKTHILNYSKTKDIYAAYRKAGYSKKFFEEHREDISIHKAAKQTFTDLNVDKLPTIRELNEEYAKLLAQKKEAYKEYRKAKQEMTDWATAKYDIERFLEIDIEAERAKEQEKEEKKKKDKTR